MIQELGTLQNFRKAKNTRLAARVFLRFSTVRQHSACLEGRIRQKGEWKLLLLNVNTKVTQRLPSLTGFLFFNGNVLQF